MHSHPLNSFSVVIPVFNEEANLDELVRRCLESCRPTGKAFEIILVDDGSRDRSAEMIEEAATAHPQHVVGVILNRNYGQHAAVMAGLGHACGDAVVTLDADLQNPPEEIPKVLAALGEEHDVVGTIRVPRCDSLFRRLGSSFTNWIVQKSTGVMMHDYGCMLRGYRRHVVEAMLACHERSTFIPILANSFARRTTEIISPTQALKKLKALKKTPPKNFTYRPLTGVKMVDLDAKGDPVLDTASAGAAIAAAAAKE
jgi:undecaprenyl-phosphate 4-deoxy-4-formamido-L-arabinose transferase